MREILFRGKNEADVWHYGAYLPYESGEVAILESFSKYGYEAVELSRRCKVIPETVGQFTGLTDKNGKKIFEGDILEFGDFIVFVVWNSETLAWECQKADDIYNSCHYQICKDHWGLIELGYIAAEPCITGEMTTEIIGNIYDNPELLKGGAE